MCFEVSANAHGIRLRNWTTVQAQSEYDYIVRIETLIQEVDTLKTAITAYKQEIDELHVKLQMHDTSLEVLGIQQSAEENGLLGQG